MPAENASEAVSAHSTVHPPAEPPAIASRAGSARPDSARPRAAAITSSTSTTPHCPQQALAVRAPVAGRAAVVDVEHADPATGEVGDLGGCRTPDMGRRPAVDEHDVRRQLVRRARSRPGSSAGSRRRGPVRAARRTSRRGAAASIRRPHGDAPPAIALRGAGSSTSTSHSAAEPRAPAPVSSTCVPRTSSMTTFAVTSRRERRHRTVGADHHDLVARRSCARRRCGRPPARRTSADRAPTAGRRCRRRRARWARGADRRSDAAATGSSGRSGRRCRRGRPRRSTPAGAARCRRPPAIVVHSATTPSSMRPTRSSVVSHGMFG